jgi:hypothetical protein
VESAAPAEAERTDICTAAAVDSAAAEWTDTAAREVAAAAESQVAPEGPRAVHFEAAAESPARVVAVGPLERSAAASVEFALEERPVRRQSWLQASTGRLTSEHPSSLTIPPVREGFKQAAERQQCLYPWSLNNLQHVGATVAFPSLRLVHTTSASIRLQRLCRTAVDWIYPVPLERCSAKVAPKTNMRTNVRASSGETCVPTVTALPRLRYRSCAKLGRRGMDAHLLPPQ